MGELLSKYAENLKKEKEETAAPLHVKKSATVKPVAKKVHVEHLKIVKPTHPAQPRGVKRVRYVVRNTRPGN